jgi:hypothetical protein
MSKRRPQNIVALRVEPPWPVLEPDDGLTFWGYPSRPVSLAAH